MFFVCVLLLVACCFCVAGNFCVVFFCLCSVDVLSIVVLVLLYRVVSLGSVSHCWCCDVSGDVALCFYLCCDVVSCNVSLLLYCVVLQVLCCSRCIKALL